MTKLYDGLIADLLENPGKYNPKARAISYAILQEKRRIMDEVQRTRTMAMIDELPETILDVLAVELRTPAYSEDFPIEIKRELIKGTLVYYSKLGTPSAVNWVIRSIFGNGYIDEWFNYGGEPHHFNVTVRNDGSFRTLAGLERFLRLVAAVKRLSSWLDKIIVITDMGEDTTHVGGTMCMIVKLPIPQLADDLRRTSTLHTGGRMAAIATIPVPQIEDTFTFGSTLRSGGRMASQVRLSVPALQDKIALSCTGRVGATGAVTVTIPLPEIQ